MSAKATQAATTYRATLPNGDVHDFVSKVHYTHVIWVHWTGEDRPVVVKRTSNPAAALKQPGQSPRQSESIKMNHTWGLVELEVIG